MAFEATVLYTQTKNNFYVGEEKSASDSQGKVDNQVQTAAKPTFGNSNFLQWLGSIFRGTPAKHDTPETKYEIMPNDPEYKPTKKSEYIAVSAEKVFGKQTFMDYLKDFFSSFRHLR